MSGKSTGGAAHERDALLQAAIDFIGTLTGMTPPPIEVAPPEVFAPFRAFVDRVQAITALTTAAAVPAEGWVMVPVEPTDAMVQASLQLDLSYMPGQDGVDRAAVYLAMLAAAPKAEPVPRIVAPFPDMDEPWPEEQKQRLREVRAEVFGWKSKADRAMRAQAAPQPAQAWPIAPDVAADLERSDWTPEEALRWYAAGKHYDTVPNGDGTSSARILDTGEVASNALRAYEQPPSSGVEPGRLLAEHVLGMDFVTDRGLRARELARKVLAQHCTAAPQPAVQQGDAALPSEQDLFERVFPMPEGCMRCGDTYAPTEYGVWAANAFVERFKGWQAARRAHPAAPVAQGDAEDAGNRTFLERLLSAMEGVIDVADRKTDEFDALRSCVIDLTVMLFGARSQAKEGGTP